MLDIKNDFGDYLLYTTFPDLDKNIKEILQKEFDYLKEKTKNNESSIEEVDNFIHKLNEFLYMERIAHKKVKTKSTIQNLYDKLITGEETFKTFGFSSRYIDILTYNRIKENLSKGESVPLIPNINFNFDSVNLNYKAVVGELYDIDCSVNKEIPEIVNLFDKVHFFKISRLPIPFLKQQEILTNKNNKRVNLLLYKEISRGTSSDTLNKLQEHFTEKIRENLFLKPKKDSNLFEYLIIKTILELFKVRRLGIVVNSLQLQIQENIKEEFLKTYEIDPEKLMYVLEINQINKITLLYYMDSMLEIIKEDKGILVFGMTTSTDFNLSFYQLKNTKSSLNIIKSLVEVANSKSFDSLTKEEINFKLLNILEKHIAKTKDLIVFTPGLFEFCAGVSKTNIFGKPKESIKMNESSILPGRIKAYTFPSKKDPIYSESNKSYLEKILSKIEIDIEYSENITDGSLVSGVLSEIKPFMSKNENYRIFVTDFMLLTSKKDYQNVLVDTDYFRFNEAVTNSFFPPHIINRKRIIIPAKDVYEFVHSPINATLWLYTDLQDLDYLGETNEINWDE